MSNFQCRPRDAGSMGILENTKNQYDELNNRFSDLLVRSKPSFLSEDTTTDDSDSLFQSIKSCKNVTFARSRSYFDDEVQLFPLTPSIATDKHVLLTSDEEEDNQVIHDKQLSRHKQNRSSNFYSVPRSPLKACSANSLTPIQTGKSAKRNISHILSFRSQPDLLSPISKPDISILSVDKPCSSRDKENLIATNTIILSPHSSHSGTSDASTVQNSLSRPMDKTPLNKSNKKISKTSTPLNKALTPNLGFKTPVSSSKTVKSRMTIEKRNSIDRAVSSAKQFIKSIPEFNKKEGNTPVLKRKCDSPATSIGLARNSLFRTPTPAGSDKPYSTGNSVTPLTGNARPSSNSRPTLTGVKNLENQNNDKTPVSKCAGVKLNSNSNGNKDKSLGQIGLSDEDNDDLPCTQPVTAILLRNVVAYVEVRCGRDYLSEGTKSELESLGARVEKNFTRKVTHCFFHGGRMSTYRKAVEWKVPLVSTLWIEACKAELDVVPLKGYEPPGLEKYKEALPLYRLKTKGLRRAVTDSKIRRKPWKEDELNKNVTQAVSKRLIPPVPTFKETDKIIDALHSVAGDLRKATNQFEKILTSPVLLKKGEENPKNCNGSKHDQPRSSSNCQRKRNKKLVFGSSSDDDNKNKKITTNSETTETSSKISDINDSEVRVSYDSDDLLVYAKKQAANTRSSAPPRLLTSRKCKKLLSSCKETEKKNNEEGANKRENINKNNEITNVRITRRSRLQPTEAEKDCSSKNLTQTKKRKLLLPSQVIANFEQDSGESTPPASPKCPYKPTPPNKKLRTGVAVKSKTIRTLADVKVMSDCDSDDSLTRAARRESSALFVKKDKKVIHQKTNPTIVCTSLSRSDEEVVKSIVAQLGTFTVEAAVSERTTHVVTPLPRRTINLLKGIARGCWVLDVQWVYKSLEAGQWVSEERYELTKFSPAVKVARSDRQAFGPEFGLELFAGLGPFYVCRATVPPSRDLAELLRLGGGVVVSNARAAKVVIGSTPPLSPCGRTLPLMVKEKWVLDCITRLTQLSFTDYIAIPDSEP